MKNITAYISTGKLKKAVAVFWALMPFMLMAQQTAAPSAASAKAVGTSPQEMIWYIIIGTMAVLLFAILILGNVLVNLVRVVIQKGKGGAAVLILLLLASGSLFAEGASAPAPLPDGGSTLAANWNMIMAGCVLLAELFVIIVLLLRIRLILIALAPEKAKAPIEIHFPKIFDSINASVAVEQEKDILLDHNYDGIRELNNSLPPWWVYSFYASIIFAVCYFSYYTILGGPSSRDEYEASVKEAQIQQEEYNRQNAGKVDENALTIADAAGIEDGKTIFTTNCAPCHGHLGEGVVGPNLTDDYWLHGGSLTDVYKTIKNGYPAKGMKSWATDLSPVQMKNVASYIKTLRGTNPPNGKAAQGDLYQEPGQKPLESSADTTKAKSI